MPYRPAFRAKFVFEAAEGLTVIEYFSPAELIIGMEERGFEFLGPVTNPILRPELQGRPKFKGIAGPMWDGDGIRYESPRAYAALSLEI